MLCEDLVYSLTSWRLYRLCTVTNEVQHVCVFVCLNVCIDVSLCTCVRFCVCVCVCINLCWWLFVFAFVRELVCRYKNSSYSWMTRLNESSVLIALPQTHCLSVRVSVRSMKGARWPRVAVTSNLISLLLPQVAMKIIDKSKLCKGDLARLFREVWSWRPMFSTRLVPLNSWHAADCSRNHVTAAVECCGENIRAMSCQFDW